MRDVASWLDELAARTARAEARVASGPLRFVGEVVNGGAIPSDPDKYYLLQPISVTGSEAEGDPGALTNYNEPVPTVVIGSVPTTGDNLVAHFVDHRWVASRGVGDGGGGDCLIQPAPTRGATLHVTWRVRSFGTSGPINTATFDLAPATPTSDTNWGNLGGVQVSLNCDEFIVWLGPLNQYHIDSTKGVITFTPSPWQVHFLAHDHAASTGYTFVEITLTI